MGLTKDLHQTHAISDVKQIQYFDSRYYKIQYGKGKQQKEMYLPSVTEILQAYPKPFLAKWRGEIGNERADQIVMEALKFGSFVHYGAEVLARGGIIIYNPLERETYSEKEIAALVKKYGEICICRHQQEYVQLHRIWQFFNEIKPTRLQTEQTVYSIKNQFAGTLDLLMWVEGGSYGIAGAKPVTLETGYYVGDYKTGKAGGDTFTYNMQIAAYMEAVMEGSPEVRKHLKGGIVIHPANTQIKAGIAGLKATVIDRVKQVELFNAFLKTQAVYLLEHPVPKPTDYMMPAELVYKPVEKPAKKTARSKKK